MPDSSGINALTGAPLNDWEHTQQSITKILTTPIGSRLMRRTFGSDIPDMVDSKITRKNVLAVYSAASSAISRWEPRFRMRSGSIARAGADGILGLSIYGTYYPRGHLGDFTVAENASVRVVFKGAL